MQSRLHLEQIAAATGGLALFPHSLEELEGFYGRILREIRAQYQLGYVSANTTSDGRWRNVEVKVTRPGVKVRARQGLFRALQARAQALAERSSARKALWYHWIFLALPACRPFTTGSRSRQISSFAVTRSGPCPSSSTA